MDAITKFKNRKRKRKKEEEEERQIAQESTPDHWNNSLRNFIRDKLVSK